MKTLVARLVAGSCLVVALAACADAQSAPAAGVPAAAPSPTAREVLPAAPTQTAAPLAEATPPLGDAYAERAVMVVAAEVNLAPEAVTVVGIEPVDWPDAGLGCPLPGMVYLQKVTPGFRVTLSAAGTEYAVHMDEAGTAIICLPDGTPLPGSIPILPGERIMDGQPWMPVN
jgi:hypothetical protein